MEKYSRIAKSIVRDIIRYDFTGMASEMAYNFILALFPFAIFLTAIFGLFGSNDAVVRIIESLRFIAPEAALDLVESVLKGIISSSSGEILTLSLIGSYSAAIGGVLVIMKGLNRAYHVPETRSFWKTNGMALLMVLIIAFIIFIFLNIIIFGTELLNFLSTYIYIPDDLFSILLLSRWPLTFLGLFVLIWLIYFFAPNIKTTGKIRLLSAIPGSLFFCIFWSIASWAFGVYVDNFPRFNTVYGTLGAVIILLLWLYYTSLIILIGGEINSRVYREIRPKVVTLNSR